MSAIPSSAFKWTDGYWMYQLGDAAGMITLVCMLTPLDWWGGSWSGPLMILAATLISFSNYRRGVRDGLLHQYGKGTSRL